MADAWTLRMELVSPPAVKTTVDVLREESRQFTVHGGGRKGEEAVSSKDPANPDMLLNEIVELAASPLDRIRDDGAADTRKSGPVGGGGGPD